MTARLDQPNRPLHRYIDVALRNVSPPVITGTPATGNILTAQVGTWNGSPFSFSYQWYSGGIAVGVNSNAYTCVSGDINNQITCAVAALGVGDFMTGMSVPTAAVILAMNPIMTLVLDMSKAFPRLI